MKECLYIMIINLWPPAKYKQCRRFAGRQTTNKTNDVDRNIGDATSGPDPTK